MGDRVCHCGLTYERFRSGYTSHRGTKGQLATPNSVKAGAWEAHLAVCDEWPDDAVSFDFGPTERRDTVGATWTYCGRVEHRPRPDEWGAMPLDVEAARFEADWAAREREARELLGNAWESYLYMEG